MKRKFCPKTSRELRIAKIAEEMEGFRQLMEFTSNKEHKKNIKRRFTSLSVRYMKLISEKVEG